MSVLITDMEVRCVVSGGSRVLAHFAGVQARGGHLQCMKDMSGVALWGG